MPLLRRLVSNSGREARPLGRNPAGCELFPRYKRLAKQKFQGMPPASSAHPPQKKLLIASGRIPAALMCLRYWQGLRASGGTSSWDIWVDRPMIGLFETQPGVNDVFRFDPEHSGSLRGVERIREAWSLRREQYSEVHIPSFMRGGQLIAAALGAKLIRFDVSNDGQVGPNAQGVTAMTKIAPPKLYAPRMDVYYARRKFGISALTPVAIFLAGSVTSVKKTGDSLALSRSYRHWPKRYWLELAWQFQERYGKHQFVFMGYTPERPDATELAMMLGPQAHNLCGRTQLHEVLALFASAQCVIGIEHDYLNLAAGLGIASVSIHGGNDPNLRGVHASSHKTVWIRPECAPCSGPYCHRGSPVCLEGITVSDVLNALETAYSGAQRARLLNSSP